MDWSKAGQAKSDPGAVTILREYEAPPRQVRVHTKRDKYTPEEATALLARSEAIRLKAVEKKKGIVGAGLRWTGTSKDALQVANSKPSNKTQAKVSQSQAKRIRRQERAAKEKASLQADKPQDGLAVADIVRRAQAKVRHIKAAIRKMERKLLASREELKLADQVLQEIMDASTTAQRAVTVAQ